MANRRDARPPLLAEQSLGSGLVNEQNAGAESARDLASLVVAQAGSLRETGDPWAPWRLLDPDGASVEAVTVFLADL